MNRIGEEQFSPSPPVFTSIFSVSTDDLGDAMASERCGLGWSFKLIPAVPSYFSFGNLIKTELVLHLEPWTVALSEKFPFNRIRCTVTVDCSDSILLRQTFTMTTTLKSSTSVLGQYYLVKQPHILTLRFVAELLSDGDAPAGFERRTANVLTDSIRSGDLINTKFYSRRCGDRGASHPRPLFASSSILTKLGCGDLEVFLSSSDFKNSEDVAIDLHSTSPDDFKINTYEYDSDSDLEDDDIYSSKGERDEAVEETLELHLRNEVVRLQAQSHVAFLRTGHVIFMKDIAFRTWNAFIQYAYFSEIDFSKLQSTYTDAMQTSIQHIDQHKCSPKSMYRPADKLGINPLKRTALEGIKSQLTRHNICKEVFSRFTSKDPEILNAQVEFLIDNCPTGEIEMSVSQALNKFRSPGDQYLQYALRKIMAEAMAAQGPFVKRAASA